MNTGIVFLVLGYVLSQFYRAFLAVLAPVLGEEIGVGADALALASGLWFLAFAAMQIPVGWALDRIGPRRTAAWLLGVAGGGGALLFAVAQGPVAINAAMILLGIGCSPVLMASYYIFARTYPATVFATLAGAVVGFGSLGNIASAWPLAFAASHIGWRGSMLALAALTIVAALALLRHVQDPPPPPETGGRRGSVFDLLRMPALWLILPMVMVAYGPSAAIRGLWVGPYYEDVFAASAGEIGQVTLLMGAAMVMGNFLYGPLDRILGTRKWIVFGGGSAGSACVLALAWVPAGGYWPSALLLAAVGFFGACFPVLMAHGRSFFPPHLTGRGVTLLNLFSIGGAGLHQLVSGAIHTASLPAGNEAAYRAIFLYFGLAGLAGCAVYLFSRDRTD